MFALLLKAGERTTHFCCAPGHIQLEASPQLLPGPCPSLSLHLHLHVAANNLKTLYLVLNQETGLLQSEQVQADSPEINTMVRDPALAPQAGTLSLLVGRLQWHLQV